MFNHISQFEPLVVSGQSRYFPDLLGQASTLLIESSSFEASLPLQTRSALAHLVTGMNCYYSNLIEGHRTLPLAIEKAVRHDFSTEPAQRALQQLALAHIKASQWAYSQRLNAELLTDFIITLHHKFCDSLPVEMLLLEDGSPMLAGVLRRNEVEVGQHVAPSSDALPQFMARYATKYGELLNQPCESGYNRLPGVIAAMAAHHRLVWIHPFLDGNGRVARIVLDVMLRQLGANQAGLWSMSRAFAKSEGQYKAALANADQPRMGNLDGQGNLSERCLAEFCAMSLQMAIDQVKFMRNTFQRDSLSTRVKHYFGNIRLDLRPEAAHLYLEAIYRGEFERGEAGRISGLGERTARTLLAALVKEGFLQSHSPKGKMHADFPVMALGTLFPNLYPAGDVDKTSI